MSSGPHAASGLRTPCSTISTCLLPEAGLEVRQQSVIDVDWVAVVNFTGSEAASSRGATTGVGGRGGQLLEACARGLRVATDIGSGGINEDQQMGDTLGL